jgi:hypothetical protein
LVEQSTTVMGGDKRVAAASVVPVGWRRERIKGEKKLTNGPKSVGHGGKTTTRSYLNGIA